MSLKKERVEISSISITDWDGNPISTIGDSGETIKLTINDEIFCMNDFMFLGMITDWLNKPQEMVMGQPKKPIYTVKNPLLSPS